MSSVTVYEHANKGGQAKTINLDRKHTKLNQVYSLKSIGMNDRISSVEWDIDAGDKFIFYELPEGQGRQYGIKGRGYNADLKSSKDFNDKASSYRLIINNSVPEYFGVISPEPKIIKFDSTHSKHGNDSVFKVEEHYQGIVALDEKHILICMSDHEGAFFFIVHWPNGFLSGETGSVLNRQRLINADFPGMELNHPGGIQLLGNVVAIPIEFIGGKGPDNTTKSSVVFYNVADRSNPVRLGPKIDRDKRASSLGMVNYKKHILVSVAGLDGQDIDFYLSRTAQSEVTNDTKFDIQKNWKWKEGATITSGWVTRFWANRYESVSLLKDTGGELYIVAFRYPFPDPLFHTTKFMVELYMLNLDAPETTMLKKISVKEIHCKERASTEFGSSIHVNSKRIHFLVSGSGRRDVQYDHSVMQLNYFS